LAVLKAEQVAPKTKILVKIQLKFSQIVFPKSGDLFVKKEGNNTIVPWQL
jgi:hypothetical protein